MGKKKVKSKRKSELRIIFFIILVALALFIVSTYAWFSTQKNVSITNLSGIVEVAEGLEISLDALNWSNEIVLGENMNIIDNAYPDHRNVSPKEMLPVSTLADVVTADKAIDIKMLRGTVTNTIQLKDIVPMDETLATTDFDKENHDSDNAQYPGYFAFDIFLKNASKQDINDDLLQLNYDSSLQIIEDGNDSVGLQNTVRVALAKYGTGATTGENYDDQEKTAVRDGVARYMAEQNEILEVTGAGGESPKTVYLSDVTMWEPNSSDHVDYIVTNNNNITWSASERDQYSKYDAVTKRYLFAKDTKMPTYALTEDTIGQVIKNIYWWDLENTYQVTNDANTYSNSGMLEKQKVLQTTRTSEEDYTIKEGVQNLFSTTQVDDEGAPKAFSIAPNSIIRLRVYVWLEGQDVDCINYASHGGGITLNLGLVKGSEVGTHGEADDEEILTP